MSKYSNDAQWGMLNTLTYSYYIKKSIDGSYPTEASYTGENTSYTFNNLSQTTNYGDKASVDIKDVEKTNAPTITLSGTTESNNYYKSNVTVTIKAGSDEESGANRLRYKVTGTQTVAQTTAGVGNSVTTTKTAKTEVYETILEAFNKGTVKIGDYVAYQPSDSSSYTILGTQSEFTDCSDNVVNQTIEREDNLNWRVFDVKNGKIRLISEMATNSEVGFAGANGYNNIVYILNKACATLYSSNNATAASINEDIYDKINTNTWNYTQSTYYGNIYYTDEYSYPNILRQEAS